LADYGFRVIIAPSFADIFFNNCFKNSMLPVCLSSEIIQSLFGEVEDNHGAEISVDLNTQILKSPSGKDYSFEVDPFRKNCLLNGLDDIGWTAQFDDLIEVYEKKNSVEFPWL